MQTLLETIEKQNKVDLTQYLKTIKIQSAQQRSDFELAIQNIFEQRNNKFETLLCLLQASQELSMKGLFSEIFTKQFLSFNDFNNKELAIDNWAEIPIEYLEEYLQKFQINLNDVQDVRQKIFTLLQNKKVQSALKLMQLFQTTIDMSLFMDKFIQLDAITEFSKICEQSPKLCNEFISKLSESDRRNHQKLATELIKKHNLNKNDYPKLIQKQNRQAVDRIYFPKIEESYERVEERLQGYPFMLRHVIEKLLENNKIDEAYSVAVRNGLNDEYNLIGNLLENQLLSNDGFGVTEYICFKESPKDYVLFEDFGITEDHVHFIDSIKKIQDIENQILQSPLTGFDTEFCHYFDEFASGGVAILQLATETDIYIFDIFNLKEEEILINFLNNYFSSNQIKIGHSVKNDFNEMARNMRLNQTKEPINLIDLSILFNEVHINYKSNVSLANQVYQVFGKKLSKKECFSNWQRRPLRKCQLYYSAMDAYICIALYIKLQESQQSMQTPQKLQQQQTNQTSELLIKKTKNFRYHVQYIHFFKNKKNMIFLVDSMLKKLAGFLRNLGCDAEYNEKNDHKGIEQQAIKEGRIIITRDKKLFEKQSLNAPCFLLSDNLNTGLMFFLFLEEQFEELRQALEFQIFSHNILNRCVKCNFDHVISITAEQAKQFLDFKNGDSFQKIEEFWQCERCLQVYWEGNQFKNSMERFSKVVKQDKQKK